jgi:hypothetical protein
MTLNLPAGIPTAQQPRSNGWIWIGEGTVADKAPLFKVETNGVVRWAPISPVAARTYLPH